MIAERTQTGRIRRTGGDHAALSKCLRGDEVMLTLGNDHGTLGEWSIRTGDPAVLERVRAAVDDLVRSLATSLG